MKKIVLTMAAILAAASVFAQSSKDRLSELEKATVEEDTKPAKQEKEFKLFDFTGVSEMGFGLNLVKEDQFAHGIKGNKSSDFFINILELSFNPTKWTSITLGANLDWTNYAVGPANYFHGVPDGDSRKLDLTPVAEGMNYTSSRLHVFSIAVPLALGLHVGSISLRAGAEANFRLKSNVKYEYRDANNDLFTVKDSTPTGLNKFALDYFASLNLGFIGLYVKYFPESISPGIPMNCITAGIVLNAR